MTTKKIERYQQLEYLQRIQNKLFNLRKSFNELNELWAKDSDYELDLNEQLKKNYPFSESFDQLSALVNMWTIDGEKNIIYKKRDLQLSK